MTARLVHRPARTVRPLPEPAVRTVEAPPNLPEGKAGSAFTALLPMAGIMGSVLMMTVLRGSQFAVIGALVLVVAVAGGVAMLLSQRGRAQRTRRTQRERYLEYLEELRQELTDQDRSVRRQARLLYPPPEALHDLVADPARLWERRRTDPDFLRVRLGSGDMPVRRLAIEQPTGSTVLTPPDPFMLNEARAVTRRFSTTPELPLTAPLDRVGHVSLVGERDEVLGVARALAVQLAVAHAPDDVGLAVACPEGRAADWDWVKWLPHLRGDGTGHRASSGEGGDAAGSHRVAGELGALATLLGPELRRRAAYAAEVRRGLSGREALRLMPRLVVVSDGYGDPARDFPRPDDTLPLSDLGVTVLHLVHERVAEPGEVGVRITVDGARVTVEELAGEAPVTTHGTPDELTPPGAEALARRLAPLRLSAEPGAADAPLSGPVDFAELLGLEDVAALDVPALWESRSEQRFLRVPVGVTDGHEPLLLDLKESAELGMGPHGLCVGATGSGKSELLRTLVLALVTTHPPEELAMVLVDYKGGATFAPFDGLPHVAGVITNLENQAGLIERVHVSLAGEVKRRQQVLKDAGDLADIGQYADVRAHRPELPPLPHLFVVIDEFGELLTAKPDFIDLFLSIGRIGRSIGIHLLLSSQRIEGGKLRGLETYLAYRLGLRTFSPDESRTVLDSTDAFHLPPLPGFGYLKVDTSVYERFKASYVSGPYTGPVRAVEETPDRPKVWPYPLSGPAAGGGQPDGAGAPEPSRPALPVGPGGAEQPSGDGQLAAGRTRRSRGPTVLSVMVDQLREAADPVPSVWLPPLPAAVPLDTVAGPPRADAERGLHLPGGGASRAPGDGPRVPLGLLDDPARQWQGRWLLDLTVAGGHVAVIGGPRSGKTTLLRTLVLSLALTHTPQEVGVYGVDLAGGGLQALSGLPHVGGIAGRADRERAARTVQELRGMLAEREVLFREWGVDSVEQLRGLRAAGRLPQLDSTDVVLVIDGFGALRDDFEELDDAVAELLKRGGGYGIHVVAGMLRWNDVRIATQSAFGTRVELRLNDPGESSVKRKLAETLSAEEPGRALTDGELFAHTALPRIDGQTEADDLGAAVERAVRAVRAAWDGPGARPVRVLPGRLPAGRLPTAAAEPARVPIGLDQEGLAPALLDLFEHDQHLMVLGDTECGKTNLLRLLARGLTERYSADELVFAVMDPRQGLRRAVPEPYRGGHAHTPRLCAALATGVADELEKRLPDEASGPDAPPAPGSSGGPPRVVVLVDDYDVIASGGQQPLAPFLPYLAAASDIGLHFVVTRRVAGASRALYEPFLTTLRESGTAALVMTGERMEGQLFPGVYAAPMPPGRGTLIRRGAGARLVQTAMAEPSPKEAGR
ncbi:type VII secretion protein EccCa [Streptomyces sp. AJS327]|uniref:type VII secretion protein EccCa n=1 Tax=Streptomyces sp. AJS327 TaxID=2545265 RepID=UPI0015DDD300|nr:type VII secretion protein EccCa [Streptomyces sp. AJS327]MBA0053985.1 type VII secretion protein EccCa [Streptomyces sp. AJS327]